MADRTNGSRRRFLLWGGMATAIVAPAAYVIERYLSPPKTLGAVSPAGRDEALPAGGSKIVKVGLKDAFVARREDGTLYALDLACTHAGCTVAWNAARNEFLCPCHDGRFSSDGAVLGGPPKLPLHRLDVEVRNGVIMVAEDHV